MKQTIIFLLTGMLLGQSENATLTIYKDGTALIKQPVAWSIPTGNSYVIWSNLPNGIHKDTPFLNLDSASIISQRFNDNIFTGNDYFKKLRGKEIRVKPKDGKVVKGTLLEISSGSVTISNSSGIISFNRNELKYIESGNEEFDTPTFNPFLSWDLQSNSERVVKGELVYKSNNFSWSTVYRLKLLNEEKGELIAEAVISNNSNMNFDSAKLQLVEGHLNKPGTRRPRPEKMSRVAAMGSEIYVAPSMGEGELGDYHIYSLNDTHDLESKENITVRMYGPLDVGYTKTYVFENSERRQKEEPLQVQLTMDNTESNGLGISLPGGKVEMYSYSEIGGLEYIGADNMGQVPKGQPTTLTSGRAFDVIGKRRVLNYDRQRKSEEAVIEIQVNNTRAESVNIQLVEHINGDWIIKHESINYQKKDASTIQFPFSLGAGETKYVTYTYRKEWK
tara:strand:- start:1235 stop:2578 length:1344 start_codon:yes stop_codon:yes gene_type:complete